MNVFILWRLLELLLKAAIHLSQINRGPSSTIPEQGSKGCAVIDLPYFSFLNSLLKVLKSLLNQEKSGKHLL